jgi:DnaJ-domain-containing protein 1
MKRYHPDRVDDLGEELQRVAHEKTLAIQRAYEELREKPRAATS